MTILYLLAVVLTAWELNGVALVLVILLDSSAVSS